MCDNWIMYGGLVVLLNSCGRLPRKFPSPVEIVASSCSPGAGLPSREGNQASAIRTQEPVAPKMGQEKHCQGHDLREELQTIHATAAYCKLLGMFTRGGAGFPVCVGSE